MNESRKKSLAYISTSRYTGMRCRLTGNGKALRLKERYREDRADEFQYAKAEPGTDLLLGKHFHGEFGLGINYEWQSSQ